MSDVKEAIQAVQNMDDEHGAFWVGIVNGEETVLEVSKDLRLVAVFDGDEFNALEKKATSWEEVEKLYALFLNGDMDALRSWMESGK